MRENILAAIFQYLKPIKCMFMCINLNLFDIVFLPSCTFLSISVSSHDISDRNIPKSVQSWIVDLMKLCLISRNVKSQLLLTFCLDAYGSQLWPF